MSAKKTSKPRTGGATIKQDAPAPPMEAFHTRAKANEGVKLPLFTATGAVTSHWLRVLGIDSDTFRKAYAKQQRRAMELATMPEEERETALTDATIEMRAALVSDWSFDMPCTFENISQFLREAPQIADKVDEFASRRAFFFKSQS